MRLLIDGHNLIGQMRDIRLDDPDDEAKLAAKLKTYCMRHQRHCTILFDNGLPGGLSRLSNSLVTVIFAPPGTAADQLLINRIRNISDPKSLTVVSSDRVIVAAAEQRRIPVIRSADFVEILNQPTATPINDEDPKPIITAAEVDYWLKRFGDPPLPKRKRKPGVGKLGKSGKSPP